MCVVKSQNKACSYCDIPFDKNDPVIIHNIEYAEFVICVACANGMLESLEVEIALLKDQLDELS